MAIINIEVSKILKIEQEFLLETLINRFVVLINTRTQGLRVLSYNIPKLRKEAIGKDER